MIRKNMKWRRSYLTEEQAPKPSTWYGSKVMDLRMICGCPNATSGMPRTSFRITMTVRQEGSLSRYPGLREPHATLPGSAMCG
jgi:hypothetical protein